jgi:hypothetical protein
MPVDKLLQHVPAEVAYRRSPLPDEQNALGPWREAVAAYVPPGEAGDDLWGALQYGSGEHGDYVAFPAGDEGRPIRELLVKNRKMLEYLHAGIDRGSMQFPIESCSYPWSGPVEDRLLDMKLVEATVVARIQAKACIADCDFAAAADTLVRLLRMGEIMCNSEGMVGHYLCGMMIRKSAVGGVRRLAAEQHVPPSVLRTLLAGVEKALQTPDGLADCLRVELCCWAIPMLDQLPQNVDLETLVDRLLEVFYVGQSSCLLPLEGDELPRPTDEQVAWQRRMLLLLLRDHPCPLDKNATARLLGEHVVEKIRGLNGDQKPRLINVVGHIRRSRRLRRLCKPQPLSLFPAQLCPGFPYDYVGEGEKARSQLASIREDWPGDPNELASWQPPTESDVLAAREKLRRMSNPIGWILCGFLLDANTEKFAREHREYLLELRNLLSAKVQSLPN